ncbi:MAG: class I SAM-dependent methyltransferase [Gammaproteobacteria bacterium]|nr:class I SAM-dependent methyltransferase [Gammaproteobacteria bacterium]MCP4089803.1 class I SAM-dependent methyltransferase [Gammaproteobacteria bacterium]MCP4278180.1 class I SAM-dependent methyltransferase [Gammaproteobacteria bacterium]MCP4831899.1 class I SAM-dependent methyltransferase [Gammaproteobacteria bacterium]MCP4927629.1 class I SAM-dependent methyltransferase [Gammaproteobacteria bacterium]
MKNNPSKFKQVLRRIASVIRSIRYRNQPERIVAMGYDEMAGDYGNWALRHERPDRDKYTKLLIDNVPKGAKLLELGCGPGDPTTKTLAQHYAVTANDISESCLELAKKNAPNAKFILSDMTALDFAGETFDAVVAYYAFHHIPRDRYEPLIKQINKWLRPGGIFMAALYPYDIEDLVTEDWHGSTMYWSSFDEEKTLQLISAPGFKIIEQSKESAIEDGKETTFLWVIAQKYS